MEDIANLFKIRDRAVKEKDKQLFLSTQIDTIPNYASDGYLSCDTLETQVLTITSVGKEQVTIVAFVKEIYFHKGVESHEGFLLYYLVDTIKGWKVFRIVY